MSKLIVVIDDDKEDLELITEMLAVKKVIGEIQPFSDAQTALRYIKAQADKLLCILCDINMPKLNGFELRKEILQTCPISRDVPFVFISTSHSNLDIDTIENLGVTAFLQKPSSLHGMEKLMEDVIAAAGLQRAL